MPHRAFVGALGPGVTLCPIIRKAICDPLGSLGQDQPVKIWHERISSHASPRHWFAPTWKKSDMKHVNTRCRWFASPRKYSAVSRTARSSSFWHRWFSCLSNFSSCSRCPRRESQVRNTSPRHKVTMGLFASSCVGNVWHARTPLFTPSSFQHPA